MSSYRNGAFPPLYSHKSPLSFQNYQPSQYISRAPHQLKKLSSFNSLSSIENTGSTFDTKHFPTATSMKSIPEPRVEQSENNDLFKNILLVAASNKWTEKEVTGNWFEIANLIKNEFKGTKKQLKVILNLGEAGMKQKRHKSEEKPKIVYADSSKFGKLDKEYKVYSNFQYPVLQKHHSLNYNQEHIKINSNVTKHKSKSVQPKIRVNKQQPTTSKSSKQQHLKLAETIESILGESERKLR